MSQIVYNFLQHVKIPLFTIHVCWTVNWQYFWVLLFIIPVPNAAICRLLCAKTRQKEQGIITDLTIFTAVHCFGGKLISCVCFWWQALGGLTPGTTIECCHFCGEYFFCWAMPMEAKYVSPLADFCFSNRAISLITDDWPFSFPSEISIKYFAAKNPKFC